MYVSCNDQVIVGPNGPAGLNDIAINHAMDTYFKVKPEEKYELSKMVRKLFNMVIDQKMEKAKRDQELRTKTRGNRT